MAGSRSTNKNGLREYAAPKLKTYGSALTLTAAGTGTVNENSNKLPKP
jgi:hypothetical protein